jgi:hypothetical protein
MRWPSGWILPSALTLLKGTCINYLLMDKSGALEPAAAEARKNGISVGGPDSLPPGVSLVSGEWPGIQLSPSGKVDTVSAGPTGTPWVDSNGWKIRLTAALHPESTVWVDAAPKQPRLFPQSYVVAIADSAARGGRWVISLDDQLAAGIAAQTPAAMATWKRITAASGFFANHQSWPAHLPTALIGVISDFAGPNEFLGQELLNLLDRTNEPYRIIPKASVSAASISGLEAVLSLDADAPSPDMRKLILAFVEAGGMLIGGPDWRGLPGSAAKYDEHPRYTSRLLGKGRTAVAKASLSDPYLLANDSVLLVGHRHDLIRFWNGGAVGSYLTGTPDGKRTLAQILFYSERGPNLQRGGRGSEITVWVSGQYRAAQLWTLDQTSSRPVEMELTKDGVELHLPAVSEYAAVELEA